MKSYSELDAAILAHVASGSKAHPMYARKINGIARGLLNPTQSVARLIDRRMQAMRKAGRLAFSRKSGWSVRA